MSLIVANPKDQRCLDWLEARFTPDQIAAAVTDVEAIGRKAYLSNVTKQLETRIPDEVWGMQPFEFEAVKTHLRALRDEFAAKIEAKKLL